MAAHNYHFAITMTCGGCSGAIERVLKRMDGVDFLIPLFPPTSLTPPHSPTHSLPHLLPTHHPKAHHHQIAKPPFTTTTRRLSNKSLCVRPPGIQSYTVNLEKQTADVVADQAVAYADVLAVIKKTGKTVTAGAADGMEMSVV